MKYLKKYQKFFEDGEGGAVGAVSGGGTAYVGATTAGMGAVVNSQPGALPGTTGTTGSGDVAFTFKKEKRKKGKPSEVTDLRDLKSVDTVNLKE